MKKSKSILLAGLIFLVSITVAFALFAIPTGGQSIKTMPQEIKTRVGEKGAVRWDVINPLMRSNVITFTSDNPAVITIAQNPQDTRWEWEAKSLGTANIILNVAGNPAANKVIPVQVLPPNNLPISILAGDVVTDPELKRLVNETLSRPVDTPVLATDMALLTDLYYYGPSERNSTDPRIESLEGLQYAINLNNLSIAFADLSSDNSLVPIENLPELQFLYIDNCKLNNASLNSIGTLTTLQGLYLGYNYFNNLDGLRPLFQAKLDEFRADPEGENYFSYYTMQTPITDFTGALPYFELSKEREIHFGSSEIQAEMNALNSTIRGTGPYIYDLAERLRPDYETYARWGDDADPITLPDIWSPRITATTAPEKNRIPIKESILDMNGNKLTFASPVDWREDRDSGTTNFISYLQLDGLLYYAALLTNNGEASFVDDVYSYFTLKTRPSFDHPGEDEYYYEGRDFNIVPYNPNATGPGDRQDPVLGDPEYNMYFSPYYIELKNFNDPVPNPAAPGTLLPNIYKNAGDTTTAIFTTENFVESLGMGTMNSAVYTAYRQIIHWFDPSAPVLEGLMDQTITEGTSFDLLSGLRAYDPTKDQQNPDGQTPKDLTSQIEIISDGGFDSNKPGTYTIQYRVISPYGIETTGARVITVVAKTIPVPPPNNGNTSGGTLPATGGGKLPLIALVFALSGFGFLGYRRYH